MKLQAAQKSLVEILAALKQQVVALDQQIADVSLDSLLSQPKIDAFARLRVSEPLTIFDTKQIFDNQPLFWDESLESGAGISSAHSTDTASTVITSSDTTAGKFTRQTFMRFNYQPGKSQQIMLTGVLNRSGGGVGVQRRIGLFDDDNGLFFEDGEGTLKIVRRASLTGSPIDTEVEQKDWNIDPMDGTGPSSVTIDWTKAQLFVIDFEWLAVGRVRFGLFVEGHIHYVHEILNANVLTTAYMSTPNLPLRYQMVTTGSSPVSTMECICATIISEGGRDALGVLRYKSTEGTHVDATTENTIYAVLGIRLKATHLGAMIDLVSVSIAEHAGSKQVEWMLIFNGTVAGSPTWANEANSAMQTFKGATANTVTGGIVVTGGHFESLGGPTRAGSSSADLFNARRLGASIGGVVDEIELAVRPIGGSSAIDVEGALTWRETP